MVLSFVIAVLAGYLLGNLNGAIIASRVYAHEDVRKKGSGNAGLTNFVRSFGKSKALTVIFLDVGKTVAACLIGRLLLEPYGRGTDGAVAAAVAVSLGHDFPAFFGFRGGKGIVCGATVALMLDWRCFLVLCVIFFGTFALTRFISLSSILAAAGFSISFLIAYCGDLPLQLLTFFIGALAIYQHRGNIARLLSGTERKFTFGKEENTQ